MKAKSQRLTYCEEQFDFGNQKDIYPSVCFSSQMNVCVIFLLFHLAPYAFLFHPPSKNLFFHDVTIDFLLGETMALSIARMRECRKKPIFCRLGDLISHLGGTFFGFRFLLRPPENFRKPRAHVKSCAQIRTARTRQKLRTNSHKFQT